MHQKLQFKHGLKGFQRPITALILVETTAEQRIWAADGNSLILFNMAGAEVARAEAGDGGVRVLLQSGAHVWAAGERSVKLYDATTAALIACVPDAHAAPISALVLAPSGFVWSLSLDRSIRVWRG